MKAIILIGGLGTRLEPLTITTPKTMVPVINKPFLEYLINKIKHCGISSIVLSAGHLANSIPEYFGNGERFGVNLHYVVEKTPLGTGGGIKNAEEYLDETFLVVNGDVFTDIDILQMEKFHMSKGSLATIALTPVDDPTRYGVIETDGTGKVLRFLEKPSPEEVTTNMINAGLIIMEPSLLALIPTGIKFSYEKQLFPALLADGKPVYAYSTNDYWIDIGTPEKYFELNVDLLSGKSCQYTPASSSQIYQGDNVSIEQGVSLKQTVVIGNDTTIEAGAVIQNSLIWNTSSIGQGAIIRNTIIADECNIGPRCIIEGAVLGSRVQLSGEVVLSSGSRVYPNTVLH
ncbi:MAG: NDP-sugar synthase [Dehalococcoidales bacterium]|jgi:mannose-1-phosphate guanylyltransferase|nr:NDP-sugar synthase [Dehalococcoidales bacterium]MDD5604404.1 NDP-sugar synthase [Dehalococcoidales bacterium]MDX9985971.1 NDP-sugar synthase [Dehalococcoidales bacterium]